MELDRETRLRRMIERALDMIGAVAERAGVVAIAARLARRLMVPADLRTQPVIVVLCGGCRFSGRLNEATCARVEHGVRLLRQGLAPRMVLSGGRATPYRPNCAPRMRALAIQLGVPSDRIALDDRSSRTVENARAVAALLRRDGIGSALLVTGPLHMRRARRCFEKQRVAVSCAPVPHMSDGAQLVREVLHEYIGLAYYIARGWA